MSSEQGAEKDLAKRLASDPIIGPELPTWLREAIARRVIEWGYTRPILPASCGCPVSGFGYRHHRHPCPRAGENESVIPPAEGYPDMPCEDCEQGLSTCCIPPSENEEPS